MAALRWHKYCRPQVVILLQRRCSAEGVPEPRLEVASDTASAHEEDSWQRGWGLQVCMLDDPATSLLPTTGTAELHFEYGGSEPPTLTPLCSWKRFLAGPRPSQKAESGSSLAQPDTSAVHGGGGGVFITYACCMRRAAVRTCTPSGRAWWERLAPCSWSCATAAAAGEPRPCSKMC